MVQQAVEIGLVNIFGYQFLVCDVTILFVSVLFVVCSLGSAMFDVQCLPLVYIWCALQIVCRPATRLRVYCAVFVLQFV